MTTQFSMTVTEAAKFYKVSKSTIYRKIKRGEISAKKIKNRWVIYPTPMQTVKGVENMWQSDVNRETAEADGLKPNDFNHRQYPLYEPEILQPAYGTPKEVVLSYRCKIPTNTPQANRYNPDTGEKIADPIGIALSRVKFKLLHEGSNDVLDEDLRDHVNGIVNGFAPAREKNLLWQKLQPGNTIRVCLTAQPIFYYLDDTGAARMDYATHSTGYFYGDFCHSKVYTLSMDQNGVIYVDNEPPPKPPEATHEGLAEYDAIIAREQAERERIDRDLKERLAREEAERKARWAREDAEREAERQRQLAEAEAERKRNEPYIQNRAKETDSELVDMLMDTYNYHMKGMPGGDQQFKEYLESLYDHSTYGTAAKFVALNFGWRTD